MSECDAETQRKLEALSSNAVPRITNMQAGHDTRIVNDEFDYGVTITFTIKNVGEAGMIRLQPWISCSEGEWSREQNLNFDAGESMDLSYFFHEPSINASNLQYGVKHQP